MTKKIKWWVWAGVGLIIILIAFKMLNREHFIRSPIPIENNREHNIKITEKLDSIRKRLGYNGANVFGASEYIFKNKDLQNLYNTQKEIMTKEQFREFYFKQHFNHTERTKTYETTTQAEKETIDLIYEYLYNQPEQTQPVMLVRLV